jgi:hypothetical protein
LWLTRKTLPSGVIRRGISSNVGRLTVGSFGGEGLLAAVALTRRLVAWGNVCKALFFMCRLSIGL